MSLSLHFVKRLGQEAIDYRFTDVNMCQRNAGHVLSCLGYDHDELILIPIKELRQACDLYLNSSLAEFVDKGGYPKPDKSTGMVLQALCGAGVSVIEFPLEAGYVTRRIKQILEEILKATKKGMTHAYFAWEKKLKKLFDFINH